MTRRQEKRRAFLTSMMALIMCAAMLVGSTFSWFTDTTSNTGNRIETGELKVELYKHNGTTYERISDGEGDIFAPEKDAEGNLYGTWEPGKTEVVLLQVKNAGTLALNYNIVLDIKSDSAENLADVLSYAIVPGMTAESYAEAKAKAEEAGGQLSWTSILAMEGVENGQVTAETITAAPNGALKAGDSDYFALVVHMDENAGNEYQEQAINIDVTVKGKQMVSEMDSFDDSYDEEAKFEEKELAVYVNNDFEGENPLEGIRVIRDGTNKIEVAGTDNKYLNIVRNEKDKSCLFLLSLPDDISKKIVVEFDLAAVKPGRTNIQIRNSTTGIWDIATPDVSGKIYNDTNNSKILATFDGENWINFAYVIDFDTKMFSVYVDKQVVHEGSFSLDEFDHLRVQMNTYEGNDLKIDNLKIYEGTEVRELP